MTTVDFITELFCRIDDAMQDIPKHPQAHLSPSEVVTMALLFALKGVGNRPFYRWLVRDYRPLFPGVPERTRLFRLFAAHQDWTDAFLAAPTVLGVADSYGVELLHPWREKRGGKKRIARRIGRKGLSNHRWIIGGKLGVVAERAEEVGHRCQDHDNRRRHRRGDDKPGAGDPAGGRPVVGTDSMRRQRRHRRQHALAQHAQRRVEHDAEPGGGERHRP